MKLMKPRNRALGAPPPFTFLFFPDEVFSLSFTGKWVQFLSLATLGEKNWTHLAVKLSENTLSGKK